MKARSATILAAALLVAGQTLVPADASAPTSRADDEPSTVHGPYRPPKALVTDAAASCTDFQSAHAVPVKVEATEPSDLGPSVHPPRGDRAFKYKAQFRYAMGTMVDYRNDQVAKLQDLTTLSVAVLSRQHAATGMVAVTYQTSPGTTWYGSLTLTPQVQDRWNTVDAGTAVLSWRRNSDPASDSKTIAEFARAHPNSTHARVGILFGCNGTNFYLDDLAVGSADSVRRWDFQGVRTHMTFRPTQGRKHIYTYLQPAYLETSLTSPDVPARFLLGQEITHKTCKADHCPSKDYSNKAKTMRIRAWPYAGWTEWAYFEGGSGYERSSYPPVIEWKVRPYVVASVNIQHPKRGQTLVVTGKISPCHEGHKVFFQRKLNHHWRTIKSAVATDCKPNKRSPYSVYRLAVKLKTVGLWNWRVKLDSMDPWEPGLSREYRQKVSVPHHPQPTPTPAPVYIPPTYTPPPPPDPIPHG
ncbi:hypothetical protein [Nocardioides sp. MH1]|uniref:hypothetical protein n=1 Tax=Nocardioides sp. MH1 TaxID=3242490 RepID=UPI00352235CE